MDFSFEKAFDKKEKDFMLAYRVSLFLQITLYSNTYNRYNQRLIPLKMMATIRNM